LTDINDVLLKLCKIWHWRRLKPRVETFAKYIYLHLHQRIYFIYTSLTHQQLLRLLLAIFLSLWMIH